MNLDFTDQVILITGGAGSIGRAAGQAFLASGARPEALEKAVEELDGPRPGSVRGAVADVADVVATREVVRDVVRGRCRYPFRIPHPAFRT